MHISAFIHATEDAIKVIAACQQLLPDAFRNEIIFTQRKLQGHHRNPIIFLETTIQDPTVIKESITTIAKQLRSTDRYLLLQDRHRYLDEKGNLYLRFDKQAAYKKQLVFSQADPIRVKIKPKGSIKHINSIAHIFPDFFLIPNDE
jgi:RNA binding exosome subunit